MSKISMAAARTNAGLTQKEMADRMGISRETYIKLENGSQKIRASYFIAFCHITGFELDDISLSEGQLKVD